MSTKVKIYRLIGVLILVFFVVKIILPIVIGALNGFSCFLRATSPYSIIVMVLFCFSPYIYNFFTMLFSDSKPTHHKHHRSYRRNDDYEDDRFRFDDYEVDRFDDHNNYDDDYDSRYDDDF